MSPFLYKRRKQSIKGKINWPDLVFYAEATGEPFQELTVTTLASVYFDKCSEKAVPLVKYTGDDDSWYEAVREQANKIMDLRGHPVQPFITISDELNVTVGLPVESITDNEIDKALALLENVDVSYPHTEYYDETLYTFSAQQIKEILTNAQLDE